MPILDNQLTMAATPVVDIAIQYPGAMNILEKYKIDYYCGGQKPFSQVCDQVGVNASVVWHEIRECTDAGYDLRFTQWKPALLIDFIIQNHHEYVKTTVPQLQELLDKICSLHGEDYPALSLIRDHFSTLAEKLLLHIQQEELVLFPALKVMFSENASPEDIPLSGPIEVPIRVMIDEHKEADALIKKLRMLTNRYVIPYRMPPLFTSVYRKLEAFDNDFMRHIHLENNILFRKAMPLTEE